MSSPPEPHTSKWVEIPAGWICVAADPRDTPAGRPQTKPTRGQLFFFLLFAVDAALLGAFLASKPIIDTRVTDLIVKVTPYVFGTLLVAYIEQLRRALFSWASVPWFRVGALVALVFLLLQQWDWQLDVKVGSPTLTVLINGDTVALEGDLTARKLPVPGIDSYRLEVVDRRFPEHPAVATLSWWVILADLFPFNHDTFELGAMYPVSIDVESPEEFLPEMRLVGEISPFLQRAIANQDRVIHALTDSSGLDDTYVITISLAATRTNLVDLPTGSFRIELTRVGGETCQRPLVVKADTLWVHWDALWTCSGGGS